jgi:hypothetical protein
MKEKDVKGQLGLFQMFKNPWGKWSIDLAKPSQSQTQAQSQPLRADQKIVVAEDRDASDDEGYGDRPCYACGDDTTHGLCTGHRRAFEKEQRKRRA